MKNTEELALAEAEKRWPVDLTNFDFAQTHALLQSGFLQGAAWARQGEEKD